MKEMKNADAKVVGDFGNEWGAYDQTALAAAEAAELFAAYFSIFPWQDLPARAVGFDLGCGSGRWARLVAPRVGRLYCIDPSSEALAVARRNLAAEKNCEFCLASVGDMPVGDNSMDFGYSLGVLHHVPDTTEGIRECVRRLKPGAPLLLYLYYSFDNRPRWFRLIWRLSDLLRRGVCWLPFPLKRAVCGMIALLVYWPLARLSALGERLGVAVGNWPLAAYRSRSYYVMRTDALDRFGTKLEKRFSRADIEEMMRDSGLENIGFSDKPPFWCAVGRKRAAG
jgi:SAM-dependent methyltransferase